MASKSAGRRKTSKSSSSAKNAYNAKKANTLSIILFAIGLLILVFAVPFSVNSGGWQAIHNFLGGLFGLASVFVGPVLIYFAIMISLNKKGSLTKKLVLAFIFLLILCAIFEVFSIPSDYDREIKFFKQITQLYVEGTDMIGGGLLSMFFGLSLFLIFGKIIALFILFLAAFVMFMIISGLTLIQFFKGISFPFVWSFKKIKNFTSDLNNDDDLDDVEKIEKALGNDIDKKTSRNKRFNSIARNISDTSMEKSNAPDLNNPIVAAVLGKEPKKEVAKEESEHLDSLIKKVISSEDDELSKAEEKAIVKEHAKEVEKEIIEEKPQQEYIKPPITLLNPPKNSTGNQNVESELKQNAENLVHTLKSFGVETRVININRGPTVTRYELQPSAGVKISKITNLADDIALNLASAGVRIEAPIPNKPAVGIEVPNKIVDMVSLSEIVDSKEFNESKSALSVALGKDIAGNIIIGDLSKMPHLLIAGATGSGKSVCINSIIMSLLYKSTPDQVRILLVDPKVVELSVYNGIPQLLIPVVTDPRKAAGALSWAVTQMLSRYKLFADNNVRDLAGYNEIAKYDDELEVLPQIVIVIDELADLMMAAPNEVEDSICRLAQMARAAGMYLVIATQRPSVDVITGVIKANIPSRIAFAVSSQVDSRTILDQAGAEKLLGRGDMLYYPVGMPKPSRIQACFVSDKEVENVVEFIKSSVAADYDDNIMKDIESHAPVPKGETPNSGDINASDELLESAIEFVVESGQASTSFLQRKLRLGYARAARIVDSMEEMGIVGSLEGSKRQVLMTKQQWYEMKLNKQESTASGHE